MLTLAPSLAAPGCPAAPAASAAALPRAQTGWLRGLDGLRAIAVCAVLLYHVETLGWAKGGYLGVDLFFVISGFLITGLLADQRERESAGLLTLLKSFYWRRAKRLLPALWLMLVVVALAAALLAPDALPELRAYTPASFLYLTNWELIRHQTSYFEAMGRQPLLLHLWSLAIEGQFYVVWGLLALLALPRLGRVRLALLTLALAAASAAWMAIWAAKIGYQPGVVDPSRMYFGTDTHGFQLLFGAALGLLWQPGRHPAAAGAASRTGWPTLIGLVALAAMLALLALLDEETAWLYPWGMLASTAASLALIWAATHPGSGLGLWLDNRLMRWIGARSYGIYLWHWPIFMLVRPGVDLPALPPAVVVAGNLALTVAVAAFSYKYIESPIHHGALERLWARLRAPREHGALARQDGIALLASAALAVGAITVLVRAPDHALPAPDVRAAIDGGQEALVSAGTLAPANIQANAPAQTPPPAHAKPSEKAKKTAKPGKTGNTEKVAKAEPSAKAETPALPAQPDPAPTPAPASHTGNELTAVGDSVLLGSSRMLAGTLKGADVHATVGWQAANVLTQLQQLVHDGQLRPVVLVHLGTNGYLAEGQVRQILTLLTGARRVILVNTHVPRRWMNANNTLLDRVAADYPNVVVADWREVSNGHRNYFVSDGVHLTIQGERAFVAEIMRAGDLVPTPAAPTKVAGVAPSNPATSATASNAPHAPATNTAQPAAPAPAHTAPADDDLQVASSLFR